MEQAENKKKKAIIAISVVTAIVLVLIISLCIASAPRKLENVLSTDNIDYIKVVMSPPDLLLTEEVERVEKVLTEEETKAFVQEVKESKYTRRINAIRMTEINHVYIYYKNGDVLTFDRLKMTLEDKDGKNKNSIMFKTIDFDFDKAFVKDVMDKYNEIVQKHLKECEMIESGELDIQDYI